MRILLATLLVASLPAILGARSKDLEVYFVDVEGGQATLMVTPAGDLC